MRCKAHPYSNLVGVCAPCLRERLTALAAAQNHSSSPPPCSDADDHPFPRSVSPYISCHRRSDASFGSAGAARTHHPPSLLFFRTPQVGPSSAALDEEGAIGSLRKNRSRKFSFLSTLFRQSKSEKNSNYDSTRSKSGSWISNLVYKSRKSRSKSINEISSPGHVTARQSCRYRDTDRGLSPDRDYCESPSTTSISDSPWRPTPSPMRRSAGHRRRNLGTSGFTVCLSPLVRPSPAHRRSQGMDVGFSGDLRSPVHHRHVSAGGGGGGSFPPALGHNRSRKIADIGRLR